MVDKDKADAIKAKLKEKQTLYIQYMDVVNDLREDIDYLRKEYENCIKPDILKVWWVDIDGISIRLLNCLKSDDSDTVGDILVRHTDIKQLRNIRNYGKKCEEEIMAYLAQYNLSFRREHESLSDFYERINKDIYETKTSEETAATSVE